MSANIPLPEDPNKILAEVRQKLAQLEDEINRLKALLTALLAAFAEHVASPGPDAQRLLLNLGELAKDALEAIRRERDSRQGELELARSLLRKADPSKPDA